MYGPSKMLVLHNFSQVSIGACRLEFSLGTVLGYLFLLQGLKKDISLAVSQSLIYFLYELLEIRPNLLLKIAFSYNTLRHRSDCSFSSNFAIYLMYNVFYVSSLRLAFIGEI